MQAQKQIQIQYPIISKFSQKTPNHESISVSESQSQSQSQIKIELQIKIKLNQIKSPHFGISIKRMLILIFERGNVREIADITQGEKIILRGETVVTEIARTTHSRHEYATILTKGNTKIQRDPSFSFNFFFSFQFLH